MKADASTELVIPSKELDQCARAIRTANNKFGKSFAQWIEAVGGELRKAQSLLSMDGSHGSEFGKWVKSSTPFSQPYASQLMAARDRMSILIANAIGRLPATESQCRELVCVPDDKVPEVWQQVVESAETKGTPITARLIREHTGGYRSDKEPEPWTLFDATTHLRASLLKIQSRWPSDSLKAFGHQLQSLGGEVLDLGGIVE